MKKTLIALAVAASAVVSGSAMAWTQNGTGGNVELGGTLTPADVVTPWEVRVGSAVTNLDASIQTGTKTVTVNVPQSILALGIRTVSNQAFEGRTGIAPVIDYSGAIDLAGFSGGITTLTLKVKNKNDNTEIGTLTAPFYAAAVGSITGNASLSDRYTYMSTYSASSYIRGFQGGLSAKGDGGVDKSPLSSLALLSSDLLDNINPQGMTFSSSGGLSTNFASANKYSAAYGAGILANNSITIELDSPATSESVSWTASLPVMVSYQ